MNTTYKVLIGVVVGLLVATGVGYLIARNTITSSTLGGVVGVGQVQTNTFWFVNGLYAGTSQQWNVSSAGVITTTGGITNSGTLTQSGAATLSGATVISGTAQVLQTTSSTLKIGTGVGNITGCLELGDSSSASTTVYITASGATVTATTTKPSACK